MSLKSRVAAILAVGCVSMAPSLALAEDGPPPAADKWEAWTELGGYAANRSYARRGELALWAPLVQDADSLFFFDLRGQLFAEDQQEANAALGYRFMTSSGWNPGVWVGFDRRNSEFGTNFDQVSFGLEALSADWDLRLNGYVPLNDREFVGRSTSIVTTQGGSSGGPGSVEVIGDDIVVVVPGGTTTATTITTRSQLYELALWGVDAEVGYRIPLEQFGYDPAWGLTLNDASEALSGRYHDLRVFVGGFYFDNADLGGDVAGPRARLEWRIENVFEDWAGSRLTFETAWQHDDLRGDQIEGGVRLRIPLGGTRGEPGAHYALTGQERRMKEGLKHNTDIVTQTQTQTQTQAVTTITGTTAASIQPVEDAVSGVDFDSITFVNNGDDLNAALAGAGGNALLVAFGGASTFGTTAMLADQTLLGGGGLLQVRSLTTGLVYTYAAPGTRPTFQSGDPGITTANNSHINHVTINAGGSIGLFVGSNQRVFVDDVTIVGGPTGIFANGTGSNLTVRNSTFSGGTAGIFSGDANQTLFIENNQFVDLDTGVVIGDNSGGVTSASLTAINNTFAGTFTGHYFSFLPGTVNLLAGSTGNVDAATRPDICVRTITSTLVGTVDFVGGDTASQVTCGTP